MKTFKEFLLSDLSESRFAQLIRKKNSVEDNQLENQLLKAERLQEERQQELEKYELQRLRDKQLIREIKNKAI